MVWAGEKVPPMAGVNELSACMAEALSCDTKDEHNEGTTVLFLGC